MIAEKIEGKLNSSYDNAKLREAFMTFDADRSGSITMEEFRRALVNYTSLEFEVRHCLCLVFPLSSRLN